MSIESQIIAAADGRSLPGFVAKATRGGTPICDVASGALALGGDAPMTSDAVFWMASMTKAITAAAAMQLVEDGEVGLDEALGPILPVLARVQVLDGFDAEGRPVLRAPRRPVTLAHLLTHTSGFGYSMWNADIGRYTEAAGTPDIGTGLDAALELPLMFDPGARWEYGVGIDLAGKVIEAISGETLDASFAKKIFAPLGMTSTGFRVTAAMAARQAGMTMRTPEGGLAPLTLPLNPEPEFWSGGGGLYGTAGDYLKFLNAILDGGKGQNGRILRPETVAWMLRHRIAPVALRSLTSVAPMLTRDLDIMGEGDEWGLSFLVSTQAGPHGRSVGSIAWAGLANTYYWADPATGTAGVLMSQLLPFADPAILGLFAAFERAVYVA